MPFFKAGTTVVFEMNSAGQPLWQFNERKGDHTNVWKQGVVTESVDETLIRTDFHSYDPLFHTEEPYIVTWDWAAPGHPKYTPNQWGWEGYLCIAETPYRPLRDRHKLETQALVVEGMELRARQKDEVYGLLLEALALTYGDVGKASKLLGIAYSHLQSILRKLPPDSDLSLLWTNRKQYAGLADTVYACLLSDRDCGIPSII